MATDLNDVLTKQFTHLAWIAPPGKAGSSNVFDIYRVEDELRERVYTGSEYDANRNTVAEDVPSNAAVTYIPFPDKRAAVYTAEDGILKQASYDPEADEWKPTSIFPENIKPNPKGNLTAINSPKSVLIYQDEDLNLVSIASGAADSETQTQTLATGAVEGTPIHVAPVGKKICLFYVHEDRFVHYREIGANAQEDQKLEGAKFDGSQVVRKIAVVPAEKDPLQDPDVYCLLEDNDVYRITLKGEKSKTGSIVDGKYTANNQAQCYSGCYRYCYYCYRVVCICYYSSTYSYGWGYGC